MEVSQKTDFAQIFSCYPKNPSCPKFGGTAAPVATPACMPMVQLISIPDPLSSPFDDDVMTQ